jgi:hypothetical protein
MRVATHPMLAGYVFKVFFIDERECERKKSRGWKDSIARCNQAELIRQVVQQYRFGHFKGAAQMAVPYAKSSLACSRQPTHDPRCRVPRLGADKRQRARAASFD